MCRNTCKMLKEVSRGMKIVLLMGVLILLSMPVISYAAEGNRWDTDGDGCCDCQCGCQECECSSGSTMKDGECDCFCDCDNCECFLDESVLAGRKEVDASWIYYALPVVLIATAAALVIISRIRIEDE